MAEAAVHDTEDPRVRAWVPVFRQLPLEERAAAILRFCQRCIRYTRDPGVIDPDGTRHGIEVLDSSAVGLDRGYGDCNLKARLFVALCLASGLDAVIEPVFRERTASRTCAPACTRRARRPRAPGIRACGRRGAAGHAAPTPPTRRSSTRPSDTCRRSRARSDPMPFDKSFQRGQGVGPPPPALGSDVNPATLTGAAAAAYAMLDNTFTFEPSRRARSLSTWRSRSSTLVRERLALRRSRSASGTPTRPRRGLSSSP